MTNVPQRIRDFWTDMYVLFDRNYLMPNTREAWDSFWKQATEVGKKYEGCPYLVKMFDLVSLMIEDRMKAEVGVVEKKKEETPPPPIQQDMGLF